MEEILKAFENFYNIIIKLRSKEGCPWDRAQTAESVRTNLLEETYECIEAISQGDAFHTAEELGDILLVVSMIIRIKEESGDFSFKEVLDRVSEKLVRRHPHVFGSASANSPDEGIKNWEKIKSSEMGGKKESLLDGISQGIPPLERAYRLQKKAAKAGFDWNNVKDVWAKVKEEIQEADFEIASGSTESKIESEMGDLFFSLVNAARFMKIDPSAALNSANEKFIRRFKVVESEMKKQGLELKKENLEIMDKIWNQAKLSEK